MFRRLLRSSMKLAALAFIAVGAWQMGHGAYIKTKAVLAQTLLEQAWAETLNGTASAKPWPWADTWPVAKLHVPDTGQSAIVLYSASGQALAFGPGHLSNTPLPGANGTAVFAAHRDTHFKFLRDVGIGDLLSVTNADGSEIQFRIVETKVVHAERSGIEPYAPAHRLALVTCWPFGSATPGPLRYVVMAEQIGL